MAKYYGFSTVSSDSQKKFTLVDHSLIKQDLMNALMTRRGQRLMFPNEGCIVWEKQFDNLAQSDLDEIYSNITSIVGADPRVTLISLDVSPSNNDLNITMVLQYVGTNETDVMKMTFNN